MTYTLNEVTSFDQTQMTPSTTYDHSLESHILLIKRLQNKLDKEAKKVQEKMESSIKRGYKMAKLYNCPLQIFPEAHIKYLMDR